MTGKRWRLIRSETALASKWLRVFRNAYDVDGRVIDDYYVVSRDDFVLVLAFHDRKLVLVRQFRPATDRSYLGLPAGYISDGETLESAARRELLEETGLRAGELTRLGELHPLSGYITSKAFVVACTAAGHGAVERDAEIDDVMEVDLDEAIAMVRRGEIVEMQAVAAILLAGQKRSELPLRD